MRIRKHLLWKLFCVSLIPWRYVSLLHALASIFSERENRTPSPLQGSETPFSCTKRPLGLVLCVCAASPRRALRRLGEVVFVETLHDTNNTFDMLNCCFIFKMFNQCYLRTLVYIYFELFFVSKICTLFVICGNCLFMTEALCICIYTVTELLCKSWGNSLCNNGTWFVYDYLFVH